MMYSSDNWDWLLRLARASVVHGFDHAAPLHASNRGVAAPYAARRATFVGLTVHGENRGCVGDVLPTISLYDSVRTNAYRAVFGDARFFRPGRAILETGSLQIFIFVGHRESNVVNLTLNDSIVVSHNGKRATLLSQYRGSRSNEDFVRVTQAKAGIPAHVPINELKISAMPTQMSKRTRITDIGKFEHEWY